MKQVLLMLTLSTCFATTYSQVKIGDNPNTINPRSLLELESTNKGLLLPRMTNTQMVTLASASAPDGMLIYNTDTRALYIMRNSQFVRIADTTKTFSFPYTAIVNSSGDGFNLSNNGTGRAIVGNGFSGNGITGTSGSGNGGYFSSSTGNALVTLSGDVGIGTATPSYQLDVNGRMRLRHNGATAGLWLNKSDNTEGSFMGQLNDSIAGLYGPGLAGSWKFMYDYKNTRIGIGTTSPQHPLVFASTIGDKISFYGGSTNPTTAHYGMGIQGSLLQMFTPSSGEDIAFGTGRSGAFTERVRFKGDGKVGIGTNNPIGSLHVKRGTAQAGTAMFEGTTYSSHFNYDVAEDTYIRGGKINSKVLINDGSAGYVGVFTATPGYPLTLRADGEGFVHTNGTVELGTFAGNGVGFFQTYSNHPLAFSTYNGVAQMLLTTGGLLGIGTSTPAQKLDIKSGRLRFTGNVSVGNPSGIEFTNAAGTALRGFVGQKDDNTLGLYGFGGSGWSFNHNIISGNTGLGVDAGTAKLAVAAATGNALEVCGGINVSGNNKPAFQLTVDASNQIITSTSNDGNQITAFRIDNALCNNDPTAMLFVTPVGTSSNSNRRAFSVEYNTGTGYWQCNAFIPGFTSVGWNNESVVGCSNSFQNNEDCKLMSYVYSVVQHDYYLYAGAKYNIMIIKQ